MKLVLGFFILLFSNFSATAQLPAYYSSISTTDSMQVLKQQLSNLITSTHTTSLSYTPGIWNLLKVSDRDLDDPTMVLLLYGYDDSDASSVNDRTRLISLNQTGSSNVGFWNREHTFAKSLGTPDLGTSGPGSDGHHLRAADAQLNSIRGSRPFAYGSGNAATVGSNGFYPGDEWKGDVARMMMYMYLRYPTRCIPTNVGDPTITVSSFDQMVDIFILWNDQDSVSDFERQRNEEIYQEQGNRNPFIDNQNFATRIWGPSSIIGITSLSMQHIQPYPNPTSGEIQLNIPPEVKYTFTICDQYGKILQSGGVSGKISLVDNPKGTYFLTLFTQDNTLHYKLMKL